MDIILMLVRTLLLPVRYIASLLPLRNVSKVKICLLSFVSLSLFGCNNNHLDEPPEVYISGGTIYYTGHLNQSGFQKMVSALFKYGKKPKSLVIDSPGGKPLSAMSIGKAVHDLQLDVTVVNKCNSACANYIFPAGKNKTIPNLDALVFHGGAKDLRVLNAYLADHQPKHGQQDMRGIIHLIERENDFYELIGVDKYMPYYGMLDDRHQDKEAGEVWFYYDLAGLKKLGLTNINCLCQKEENSIVIKMNFSSIFKIDNTLIDPDLANDRIKKYGFFLRDDELEAFENLALPPIKLNDGATTGTTKDTNKKITVRYYPFREHDKTKTN